MSVTKTESGNWNARFPVGGGKYKNKVFDKKRDAEDYVAKMRGLVRGGQSHDPKKAKEPLEVFAWDWYSLQPDTPNYRQNISSHLRNHLLAELGGRPIGTITENDMRLLVKKMEAQPMVPTSIRTVMTTVRMVFRSALKTKIILEDPTLDLKLPKIVEREIRPLTVDQVRRIADRIFPRYRAVVMFASASGLRQGEVFGLKVTDICWEKGAGAVTVYKQIQSYTGQAQRVHDRTKSSKDRTVPLDDAVLDLLREHLAEYPAVDGYIFTNTLGKPLHRRVFDRAFDAAQRRAAAGLRDVADEEFVDDPIGLATQYAAAEQIVDAVFHSLRHFYASLLIRQGLSPKAVAARLGHKNVMMTLARYTHLWPDDEDRTREATKILFVD